jgi:hypothetical protein
MTELKVWQERFYEQYLKDEKHLIWQKHGEVGDIAELGLIVEIGRME